MNASTRNFARPATGHRGEAMAVFSLQALIHSQQIWHPLSLRAAGAMQTWFAQLVRALPLSASPTSALPGDEHSLVPRLSTLWPSSTSFSDRLPRSSLASFHRQEKIRCGLKTHERLGSRGGLWPNTDWPRRANPLIQSSNPA